MASLRHLLLLGLGGVALGLSKIAHLTTTHSSSNFAWQVVWQTQPELLHHPSVRFYWCDDLVENAALPSFYVHLSYRQHNHTASSFVEKLQLCLGAMGPVAHSVLWHPEDFLLTGRADWNRLFLAARFLATHDEFNQVSIGTRGIANNWRMNYLSPSSGYETDVPGIFSLPAFQGNGVVAALYRRTALVAALSSPCFQKARSWAGVEGCTFNGTPARREQYDGSSLEVVTGVWGREAAAFINLSRFDVLDRRIAPHRSIAYPVIHSAIEGGGWTFGQFPEICALIEHTTANLSSPLCCAANRVGVVSRHVGTKLVRVPGDQCGVVMSRLGLSRPWYRPSDGDPAGAQWITAQRRPTTDDTAAAQPAKLAMPVQPADKNDSRVQQSRSRPLLPCGLACRLWEWG